MRKEAYELALNATVDNLRAMLSLGAQETVKTAIVLGTGWADAFAFEAKHKASMTDLGGTFADVEAVEGHARCFEIGTVNGHRIIVLRGRVHMNEFTFNPAGAIAVRAQIEVLLKLGVKKLILTAGVGALKPEIRGGEIIFITGWVSSWSETMPLFPGEFVNAEETIRPERFHELSARASSVGLAAHQGLAVFWRGPNFEGRKRDKAAMSEAGGSCVGMSIKPEAVVAALYPDVEVIPVGFFTNGMFDPMTHERHRDVALAAAPHLGAFLPKVVDLVES